MNRWHESCRVPHYAPKGVIDLMLNTICGQQVCRQFAHPPLLVAQASPQTSSMLVFRCVLEFDVNFLSPASGTRQLLHQEY